MKMLWKLTDNIKYEDCEVSAAPAQSSLRPLAWRSTLPLLLLSMLLAAKCGWKKLSPALRPPLEFARRARGRSRRGWTWFLLLSLLSFGARVPLSAPFFFCLLLGLPESGTKRHACGVFFFLNNCWQLGTCLRAPVSLEQESGGTVAGRKKKMFPFSPTL